MRSGVRTVIWVAVGGGMLLLVGAWVWFRRGFRLIRETGVFPPDHWSWRAAAPRAIMIHHTDTGSPAETRRVLLDRGLSTHYEVDPAGVVHQYLDPLTVVAWHGGPANAISIGIDVTHRSGALWPRDQVAAVAALVADLGRRFQIRMTSAPDGERRSAEDWVRAGVGVIRHRDVVATACPEDFPMEAVAPMAAPVVV